MFNRFTSKLFLNFTGFAPLFLLWAVSDWLLGKTTNTIMFGCLSMFLVVMFLHLQQLAKNVLSVIVVESKDISDIYGYDFDPTKTLLMYAICLCIDSCVLRLVLIVFWGVFVYCSNDIFYNPLFNVFGYHLYKLDLENEVGRILITKRLIKRSEISVYGSEVDDFVIFDKEWETE